VRNGKNQKLYYRLACNIWPRAGVLILLSIQPGSPLTKSSADLRRDAYTHN
jgi:hypothetical protein